MLLRDRLVSDVVPSGTATYNNYSLDDMIISGYISIMDNIISFNRQILEIQRNLNHENS